MTRTRQRRQDEGRDEPGPQDAERQDGARQKEAPEGKALGGTPRDEETGDVASRGETAVAGRVTSRTFLRRWLPDAWSPETWDQGQRRRTLSQHGAPQPGTSPHSASTHSASPPGASLPGASLPGTPRRGRLLPATLLAAALVTIVAGVLHREAAVDPWADDRLLVMEPSWFQMAAPRLHAAVPGAVSIAHGLTRVVDPLSRASTTGDIRALAACLAGLSAGGLLLLLARLRVPLWLAAPLALSGIGLVLPASTATSLTHALQMLLGVSLLLLFASPSIGGSWRRIGLLGAVTCAGGLNHPSFLALAAIAWIAAWRSQLPGSRSRVLIAGPATLAASLAIGAWLVHLNAAGPIGADLALAGGRPSTLAIAAAILSGRFAAAAQPTGHMGLMAALTYILPGPSILALPLAAAAFLRGPGEGADVSQRPSLDGRRLAAMLACGAAALWLFVAGTWLPDPGVAAAPARLAIVALAGLGLAWVAAQAIRGARTLAIVAAIVVGLYGFADTARWSVPLQTARLQAFVESASAVARANVPSADGGATVPARGNDGATVAGRATGEASSGRGHGMRWVAERLAIDRALLFSAYEIWGASRLPGQAALLQAVAENQTLLVFSEARARFEREGAWIRSIDLPYPTAASFLASQLDNTWVAVAAGDAPASAEPFLRDLVARFHATPLDGDTVRRLAGLGRIAAASRDRDAGLFQRDHLEMTYGQQLAGARWPVPARFAIETTPIARISVNGTIASALPPDTRQGVALALFDPWRLRTEDWLLGTTPETGRPTIRDTRLQAACLVAEGPAPTASRPRLPLLASTPLTVPLASPDTDAFGPGWHGPEQAGPETFRWTGAEEAHLRLLVSHRQAIRVRIRGSVAEGPAMPSGSSGASPNGLGHNELPGNELGPNQLGVSWNGTVVPAPGPWTGEATWTIPVALVRRGLNVLGVRVARVVRPADHTPGGETRRLGAAITLLSFAPADAPAR